MEDSPAPYNNLLSQISNAEVLFAPPGRVEVLFADKQVDCLFPGSTEHMEGKDNFIQSAAVQELRAYIFSRKKYHNLKDFNGKNIGIQRGFSYGKIRERFEANFVELTSNENAFNMLNKQRLDAVVAYLPDALAVQDKMQLPSAYYAPDSAIHAAVDAFVCHKEAEPFIMEMNSRLIEWQESGQLQAWLTHASGDSTSSPENAEQQ